MSDSTTRAEARRRGILTEYVDAQERRRRVSIRTLSALLDLVERPSRGGLEPSPRRRERCHLPRELNSWAWAVQLYSLRSATSWGIGDLGDLRRLARWSRTQGAGLLLLNPLGASLPLPRQQPSPYYPSSRRYLNPLYIDVDQVSSPRSRVVGRGAIAPAGRGLNRFPLIDRDAVFKLKMRALAAAWRGFDGSRDYERFRAEGGRELSRYATFCALTERFGTGWQRWPKEFQNPNGPAVARFARRSWQRLDFHVWLQWVLDRQLRRAAHELPLMHDLAVGFDPDGADAWEYQDLLAHGARIGAPPDLFNPEGQDWGLPPFEPNRLRAADYLPLRQTLRTAFKNRGGVRIDHILGFFRLWWIPPGLDARDGAYVTYPAREMLDVLARESAQAEAVVVAEDLGTVPPEVRPELARRRILSSRVLWFEDRPPKRWPRRAMGAVTTHDLPTVAGVWTGSDIEDQQSAGRRVNAAAEERLREKLTKLLPPLVEGGQEGGHINLERLIEQTYRVLAESPSAILTATLEDACASPSRPNMPGTVDTWPNWSIPLPLTLEQLLRAPLSRSIAAALNRGGPG